MLALWAIAAVVIGAGVLSIVGALRRTMARPPFDRRHRDGGPMFGHHDDGDGDGDGDGGGD